MALEPADTAVLTLYVIEQHVTCEDPPIGLQSSLDAL